MGVLRLYVVDDSYIDYLRKAEPRIYTNKESGKQRPYVGVILNIDEVEYFACLTSPKQKHSQMVDGIDFVRLESGGELKAVMNINYMIPIRIDLRHEIDIDNEQDLDYKQLLNLEMIAIRKKQDKILNNAKIVYNKVTKYSTEAKNKSLVGRSLNFLQLEELMNKYSRT